MTNSDITHRRLHNHQLTLQAFDKPHQVVEWLGAVQSQDYAAAKWAVGQRLPESLGITDHDLEQAFTRGDILRTHVMRPTWHFVTPSDIRWLLALTGPRVHAATAYYYRQFGLDDALFMRSNEVLAKALQGGKQFTRPELIAALKQAGIDSEGMRAVHMLVRAEVDGIICSGARRGKDFTYALLEERAPNARTLEREEALSELTRRYFISHGPATLQDFVWWSGLTMADAKAGVRILEPELVSEDIDEQTYWFSRHAPAPPARAKGASPVAYLLPNYDEYGVAYKDRSAFFDAQQAERVATSREHVPFGNLIVVDGQGVGFWKRTLNRSQVSIETKMYAPLNEAETQALAVAAERYGKFIGLPVVLR